MLKKVLFSYIAVWFVLAGFSIARYPAIWKGRCYFQTMGWLLCTPELSAMARIGLSAGIVGMFTIFIVAGWFLWKNKDQLANLNPVLKKLLFMAGICAVFVLPLGMSDWPYYFSAGQAVANHINPYISQWTHQVDFSYPMFKNTLVGFSYGPIITAIFKWLYMVSQGQAAIFLLIWKVIMFMVFVGCGFLTMKLVKLFSDKKDSYNWYILWLAQPLLLFEWVVNGHFDGLWLFFLLLAIYAAHTKRWWLVIPALTIGIWIKFIPVLLVPFFGLWWWQEVSLQTWKKLLLQMGLGLAIAGFITVFSWGPYWAGTQVFSSLIVQSKWAVWSVFAVIYYSLKPLFVWLLAGQAHWYLTRLVQGSLLMAFVYMLYPIIKKGFAILLKKERWESGQYVQAILIFLLVYLLVWQKSFTPWYSTWFIPLGLIIFQRYHHSYVIKIITWLSVVSLVFHLVFLSNWLSQDPNAGSQLWFYYFVVGSIIMYPLYLIFRWRQKNYSTSEKIETRV